MRKALLVTIFALFAGAARANTTIDTIYDKIHEHVCRELTNKPCPQVTDDEKWAIVTTWCDLNKGHAECASVDAVTGGPVVIAFHHDSKVWRPIYGVESIDIGEGKDGAPRVLTTRGRTVIAVVESTSPLLYISEVGAITSTDGEAIAALQNLFDVLGPSVLNALGAPAAAAQAAAFLDAGENDLLRTQLPQAIADAEKILQQWRSVGTFIQRVENRRPGSYTPMAPVDLDAIRTRIENAAALMTRLEECRAGAEALLELLNADPSKIDELRAKEKDARDAMKSDCGRRLDFPAIALLVDDRATGRITVAEWQDEAQAHVRRLNRIIDLLNSLKGLSADATALAAADKQDELAKMVAEIEQFETRLLRSVEDPAVVNPRTAIRSDDVATFFVAADGPIDVVWEKNRSRSLTVKKSSPWADKVVATRGESVATAFEAGSLSASLVDVAVAVTHTQLESLVFGTVSEDDPQSDDPEKKIQKIAIKDREERSGQLGVFLRYPVFHRLAPGDAWSRALGMELGVGVNTDQPAFFLGLSWAINRAMRVGAGATWQQVKVLDGQSIGDLVAAETDIKQDNELDQSWYVSFSFSLGSLTLFNND